MIFAPLLAGQGSTTWNLELGSDDQNVNLKDALEALYGPMVVAVSAVVRVAAGVTIGSANPSTPAMTTGTSWPSGSTLKIINDGKIYGAGGVGASFNGPGGAGGDALDLRVNVTIDNTNGQIFGGGGGGGPGGGDPYTDPAPAPSAGAGGGGQGSDGGPGGTGDTGAGASNGSAGSSSGSGSGADGANGGQRGGAGGGWGSSGAHGNDPASLTAGVVGGPGGGLLPGGHFGFNGGNGYAGGRAVRKNSRSITWLGGNNTSQVKGLVA